MTKLEKLQEIQKENFTQGKYVDENSTEQEVDEVYELMQDEKKKEKKEEEEKLSLEERLRIIRDMQTFEKKNKNKEREEEIRI